MALKAAEKIEKLTNIIDGVITSLEAEVTRLRDRYKVLPPTSAAAQEIETCGTNIDVIAQKATTARAELVEKE